VFTGEYRHTVDEKGRVAVPVRFRAELAAGAVISKWIDGCIAIHPRSAWEGLAAKASSLPVTNAGARTFQRFLFGAAFDIELDRQGRLVVPVVLREFAGLEGESSVVVVGSRDHLELWSSDRWSAYSAGMDAPDVLAEHLSGLGI
jgi:MraZ protein